MKTRLVYRVFCEPTGFYFCDDSLPYLDTRGTCYPDAASATAMAIEIGRQCALYDRFVFDGVIGSGVCVETARSLCCPVILESDDG